MPGRTRYWSGSMSGGAGLGGHGHVPPSAPVASSCAGGTGDGVGYRPRTSARTRWMGSRRCDSDQVRHSTPRRSPTAGGWRAGGRRRRRSRYRRSAGGHRHPGPRRRWRERHVDPFGSRSPFTSVGAQGQEADLSGECHTGADADQRQDCRIVAVVNSVQEYWAAASRATSEAADRVLHRPGVDRLRAATSAVGPFYCPADADGVHRPRRSTTSSQSRFGAQGGPFAEAYVIAHEYGHHVQHLLGADAPGRATTARAPQSGGGAPRAAGRLLRRRVGGPRRGDRARSRSSPTTTSPTASTPPP